MPQQDATIQWPFGAPDEQSKAYAATVTATIKNRKTIVTVATLTGALALALTADAELPKGSTVIVKLTADGTNRVVTPSTGTAGVAFTVTASKTAVMEFFYDGTTFHNLSATLTS